jgi:hypothetical protein
MTFDSSLLFSLPLVFIAACLGLKEFRTKMEAENVDGQLHPKRFAERKSDCECSVEHMFARFYDDPLNHAVIFSRRTAEIVVFDLTENSHSFVHTIYHLSGLSPD